MTPIEEKARELLKDKLNELMLGELGACCMDDDEDRAIALEVLTEAVMDFTKTMIQATLINSTDMWFDREEYDQAE